MSLKTFELYQLALEFFALSNKLANELPRGHAELRDQLKRASLSIVLNVAEGAGHFTVAQQKRHYSIARASAFECQAAVEAVTSLEGIDLDTAKRSATVLGSISSISSVLRLR